MLHKVAPDGPLTLDDTNLGDRHRLFTKDTVIPIDILGSDLVLEAVPKATAGLEISRIDVIVTLRRARISPASPRETCPIGD